MPVFLVAQGLTPKDHSALFFSGLETMQFDQCWAE